MLLILLLWLLVFFIFISSGYPVLLLLYYKNRTSLETVKIDEAFFMGFLTISVISGFLSLWIPLGRTLLIALAIISIFLFSLNYSGIMNSMRKAVLSISLMHRYEIALFLFLVLFLLMSVAHRITWGDTESYHVQAIKWIREYPVVPGLGNIHGRFAFNSMFFVVSSLFSFQVRDVLIFPLNGICYAVLISKLFTLYSKEIRGEDKWKALFYGLTLLVSMLFMISSLNSPSADAICGTLIIYLFALLLERIGRLEETELPWMVLVNLVIFSCIAFKLSSFLIVTSLIMLYRQKPVKKVILSIVIGTIVIAPFILRNYFLSGYVAYPFPAIDIFRPDWKIPYENVLSMKQEIEGWAKLSSVPYPEVVKMGVQEWFLPWFRSLGFNDMWLFAGNTLSIFLLIIMLIRKEFFLALLQIIILTNLLFWFLMAPDIRFAYGFLFTGFALGIAYIVMLIASSALKPILKFVRILLLLVLILVAGRKISGPLDTLQHPSRWLLPDRFGTVETELYSTNFEYRTPVERGGCLNTDIPCVPFPFDNVFMRGNSVRDGFRVDTTVYSGIHYID